SLAASPSGEQVAWGTDKGTVWVWTLATGSVSRLGPPPAPAPRNAFPPRVSFLTYTREDQLVSCGRDGRVLEWNASNPNARPSERFAFGAVKNIAKVVLSPDRQWLAARGDSWGIELRSWPDGQTRKVVRLPKEHQPQSVAFTPDGRSLAIGVRVTDADAPFLYHLDGKVFLYDLRGGDLQETGRLKMTEFANVMAYSPDGKRLAIAGGDNHEVTLWDPAERKPVFALPTPGHTLWQAALSEDGKLLGVRDQRHQDAAPRSPNHAGAGDYHVFDFGLDKARRDWSSRKDFRPVEAVESLERWTVRIDREHPDRWEAVEPDGTAHELVLERHLYDLPRCYTFLKPAAPGKPVRLAVGHYWGVSLYEMNPRGRFTDREGRFVRCRVYVGHQGYVTSVAPSADHGLLITASRDMTVNCWSLADWPSQAEVGVAAVPSDDGKKLVVTALDAGSPAWQAGLAKGGEFELLASADPDGPRVLGKAAAWQKKLENAGASAEFVALYRRPGEAEAKVTVFTARQRPVWRFFPTFAPGAGGKSVPQDWVLWRWQDYYYDASTDGDHYVGWQISGDPKDPPLYHPADRFRERFFDPLKVRGTLVRQGADPVRLQFRDIEPPKVTITGPAAPVNNADVTVTVGAQKVGVPALQNLQRVEIWLNDRFLVKTFVAANFVGGNLPATPWTINAADLQSGQNTIKAIAINNADGRGEAVARVTFNAPERKGRRSL
ncbi:MAG TPA: hypothetical protein VFW33_18745, partial [Gemmataceae bacterium]|nr:hypothetical protein [Gemmataceae bacterium]